MHYSTIKQKEFENEALFHVSELRHLALRYVHNLSDADDLVQETLLHAYASWNHFQKGTNCRAWLIRIMVNRFIDNYRRSKNRAHYQNEELQHVSQEVPVLPDPEDALIQKERQAELCDALSEVPKEFRDVVVLADLGGKSYREISKDLNCPLGTVMSRLFRGRRLLETLLTHANVPSFIPRTHPAVAA